MKRKTFHDTTQSVGIIYKPIYMWSVCWAAKAQVKIKWNFYSSNLAHRSKLGTITMYKRDL